MKISWKLIGTQGSITPIDNSTCQAEYIDGHKEEFTSSLLPQYIKSMGIYTDDKGMIQYSHFPVEDK